MQSWLLVRHLFEVDDGSLPDVFVEGLSGDKVVSIYNWVVSMSGDPGDKTAWCISSNTDVLIRKIASPAQKFIDGKIETFRHPLNGLCVNGTSLPLLTISLDSSSSISFDYRKGSEWKQSCINAFFELLAGVHALAPSAEIWQADEGTWDTKNPEFSAALKLFENASSKGAL
ncbi:MAG: hypothetical protein ACN6OS_07425 [Comamonas testosteroni]|uniref:hypothetical protein n=1 Tax=Comamonas testosteroni TaxID=285 RepID=UPI003D0ED460